MAEEIMKVPLEDELQSSYLEYAMSVIVGRAIPDVRDGLKPVQRRILYAMYNSNNVHSQPTKKSVKAVSETMGKFHPHGDAAIYEALVRMAQDFSMNHTLVEGQGNFGSTDGDPPAAMRYTEARLAKFADELLNDLDKNTVNFIPNFDNTEKEPEVLPAAFPNLLVNGTAGIAVGVATSIPPHNLGEVLDAVIHILAHKEATVEDMLAIIKGPDFPTGGIAIMSENAYNGYRHGKGQLTIKARTEIDEKKNRIVITEMPYNVNKSSFVENVASLARDKRITGIRDIRDESDMKGVRVVIELKQDASAQQILNQLFRHTQLQVTFPLNNLAVLGNTLRSMNVLQMLTAFLTHRREVVVRRSRYELDVAKDRLHIVDGLLIAIASINEIIKTIKESKEVSEARSSLISKFNLSEKQANAILDMKLSRLTKLENSSLSNEKIELEAKITYYSGVLADPGKIDEIIRTETLEIKKRYARPRRTEIVYSEEVGEIADEDLITDEESVIMLTKGSYLKRMPAKLYKTQGRGGKGVISIELKEGDFVKKVVTCMSKDYLLLLTNLGRALWIKAYVVPEGSRYGAGKAAINLVKLLEGEQIQEIINTREFSNAFMTFITRLGKIKRIKAESFSHPRVTGIKAMPLRSGDELASVVVSNGSMDLLISTMNGKALRFKESDIRAMGRGAHGIRGIRLGSGDKVQNIIAAKESSEIATISQKGYGKVTQLSKYRLQRRGGKGVINMRVNDKTGSVIKSTCLTGSGNILIINSKGLSIEIESSVIRRTGRSASGVRLMRLEPGSTVVDVQPL